MRSAPANYLALLDNPNLNPVWIVIFDGLPDDRGRFCSGDFGDIDSDWKKHVVNVRLRFGTIDLLEPHTDANEYEFEIVDKDLIFTNVLKDYDLLGGTVTIKIGFAELDEADFVTLPSVTIERISLGADYLTWRIVAKDEFFRIKQKLFSGLPTTQLDGAIAAGATTVSVDIIDGFIDPIGLPDGIKAGLIIDNELKSYTGISGNDFTSVRTEAGTGDVSHEDNALVTQALIFFTHELIAFLYIACTTRAGGNGFYDLGLPWLGLEIPAANIEIESIEKTSYRISSMVQFDPAIFAGFVYTITPKDRSLQWLEKKLLHPNGCYFISNNGKIDVGALDYVWDTENFASDRDIANDEIIDAEFEFIEAINLIQAQHQQNPVTEAYFNITGVQVVSLQDSVDEYGINALPFDYASNDSNLWFAGQDVRSQYRQRKFFDYYGDISATIRFSTLPRCWLLEPGDDTRITYNHFPELTAGTRGWTNRKVKILGQEIDFAGECKFTGISYQMFTRVAGMTGGIYSLNDVPEVNIDDTAVAFSINEGETPEVLEAADGYYDNSGTNYEADQITFFIEVQEPGTGAAEETISIRVSAVTATNVLIAEKKYFNIRYDATGSALHEIAMTLSLAEQFTAIDHVKVEWYDRSSPTGADQPTVSFVGVWFIVHERDMTQLAPT